MREPQQTLQADEEVTLVVSGEEATLVSPRFDDEETLVARPVVPLDAGDAAPPPSVAPRADSPLPAYARRPFAPRRPWVLATVLVSVLVGGVLGGAGLYIYQRQSQEAAAANPQPAPQPQPEPAPETQQPAPETTAQTADAPQPEAPAADAEVNPEPPLVEAGDDASAAPAEPEQAPAAERRDGANGGAVTRKRGKKGEHDDEAARPVRVSPRPDGPVARDDSAQPEARRVDSISYRPRRAARRAERRAERRARREAQADADRLRRIFEGPPE